MTLSSIRKALTPAALGVLGVLVSWVATGDFDIVELRITGAALVTALAVYAVPNLAVRAPFLKALVPAVLGVVAVGTSALESGAFNEGDLRTALAALLTSAVVFFVRNEPAPAHASTNCLMARRNRRLYFVALALGILVDVTLGTVVPSAASIHVVSNSECSNGNLEKSQNPPGQSKLGNRAASRTDHRDVEDC